MAWQRLKDTQLQQRFKIRAKIISHIREFFVKEGFLEVETPILVPYAGQEPYLNPMKVEFFAPPLNLPLPPGWSLRAGSPEGEKTISSPFEGEVRRGYLITSPEYAHKKLLAAGFEKTFEITRAFRAGEQWGGLHNPEFTILEWYRARADYFDIMGDVEAMVQYVIKALKHKNIKAVEYQGKVIDFSAPWERLAVGEAFEKYAKLSLGGHAVLVDRPKLRGWCRDRGYKVGKEDTYEDLFFKIFLTEIEPKLGYPKPTILYDYPAQMAALARLKPSPYPSPAGRGDAFNPPLPAGEGRGEGQVAERFELYIAGIELANAFSELTDASEQRRRFLKEQKLRKKLGKEIIPLDEDFLDAVGHMPPSAGIALGVDRLVMLLTNAKTIGEVLTFPANELF